MTPPPVQQIRRRLLEIDGRLALANSDSTVWSSPEARAEWISQWAVADAGYLADQLRLLVEPSVVGEVSPEVQGRIQEIRAVLEGVKVDDAPPEMSNDEAYAWHSGLVSGLERALDLLGRNLNP